MQESQDKPESTPKTSRKKPPYWLFALPFLMFGFGYAMVPLYNVFCEITGLNGKTGRWQNEQVQQVDVDTQRQIKVEFLASLNQNAPFDFAPEKKFMWVHPGKPYEMNYIAKNLRSQDVVGQAVPSVAPSKAAAYFNKTECFCFQQQPFLANEEKSMPVVFIVDPDIPQSVKTISLSYTFFDSVTQLTAK